MTSFPGFEPKHFDAYEERKWSSNRYNLERMRVREVVEALAAQAFASVDIAETRFTLIPTQDHPTIFNHKRVDAQWVLLGRTEAERQRLSPLRSRESALDNRAPEPQPQLSSANLGLRVDVGGFEVAVRIHLHASIDRHNMQAKLKLEEHKASFLELLQALPDAAYVAIDSDVQSAASSDLTTLETLANALTGGPTWISVGFAWGRDHEAINEPMFADEIGRCVAALLPIYDFIAWTDENDFIDGRAFIEEESNRRAEKAESEASTTPPDTPKVQPPGQSKNRPSTRGGWSYRPDWQFDPTPSTTTSATRSPSARVRERSAQLQREAQDWNYSGPTRERRPQSDNQRGRQDRGRPPQRERDRNQRDNRHGSGRGSSSRGGQGRSRGPRLERGDRRGAGGRRDTQRGPATTKGRKSVEKTHWVDAPGDIGATDYVRITDGLFSGKVAQVVDQTKKGFRVVLGDGGMTVEVPSDGVMKIEEKN